MPKRGFGNHAGHRAPFHFFAKPKVEQVDLNFFYKFLLLRLRRGAGTEVIYPGTLLDPAFPPIFLGIAIIEDWLLLRAVLEELGHKYLGEL